MRISRVELHNWERFRGTHDLRLEAKAYSIVARHERDPEHSNWLGKSSFTRAIRFALYGDHPYPREDDWITRGQPEGKVSVFLDVDGKTIHFSRQRSRGKPGSLSLYAPGAEVASGDSAQAVLERLVGLRLRDYKATCEFEQGEVARLVTAKPEERMAIVGEWLQLAPLERAAEHNAARIAEVLREKDRVAETIRLGRAHRESLLGGVDASAAGVVLQELSRASAEAEDMLARARARWEETKEAYARASRDWDYQHLVEEGKKLAAEVEASDEAALQEDLKKKSEAWKGANEESVRAHDRYAARVKLRVEGFDGTCPMTHKACPAAPQVDEEVRQGELEIAVLRRLSDQAVTLAGSARAVMEAAGRALLEDEARFSRLEELRERARKMVEEGVGPAVPLGQLAAERSEALRLAELAEQAARDARLAEARQRDRIAEAEKIGLRIAELEGEERGLSDRLATLSEAALILGRGGAQRRISEPFLAAIGEGANEALQECGVALTVGVRWEHEGRDPARACAACGFPFPDSRKVKECARCGAARGKNIINRLEFPMSSESGAARDLAGIALQLSAAEWLRGQRGAAWRVACLDEPLAQCDRAHRRVMTRAFAAMLTGRFGFEQAFVVSHSPETQAALPGTILVTGDDEKSRIEVVA